MKSFFTSQFFANNRANLRQLFTGTAPIIFTANGLMQRSGDTTFSFAQDASFWYLTGIDHPDVVLVMDKNQEYLIIPELDKVAEFFDGAIDPSRLSQISGIKDVYPASEGFKKLADRVKKVKHVATLAALPTYEEHYRFYSSPARAYLVSRLKSFNPNLELLDLGFHLSRLRMIKQPPELEAIKAAITITEQAIKLTMKPKKLANYNFEYELEADLTRLIRIKGATGYGFSPIVASGINGCTLHSTANEATIANKSLVLVDMGAEVEHYAADISRTYIKGSASKRQQVVHAAVLEVQDYALSLLKPGVILKDYEQKVAMYMGEKLRELGLIKIINQDNVRRYFPSATSHFLGLNVHDVGDYARPLEPGVVLTVEPGIYIQDEAIGVRLEDDVIITEDGIQNLTASLPKGISLI